MAYEQRDNSGTIFHNDRKEKDTHPDSKGSAMIGGVEYWVSAWRKTGQSGKPFLSLSFTRKEQNQQTGSQGSQSQGGNPEPSGGDYDDSIPF